MVNSILLDLLLVSSLIGIDSVNKLSCLDQWVVGRVDDLNTALLRVGMECDLLLFSSIFIRNLVDPQLSDRNKRLALVKLGGVI